MLWYKCGLSGSDQRRGCIPFPCRDSLQTKARVCRRVEPAHDTCGAHHKSPASLEGRKKNKVMAIACRFNSRLLSFMCSLDCAILIGQFGPAIMCRLTLCASSAWITETECVFYSVQESKFRAASFRPTLIGNACKACHSRYNAHLFSCLVCIKEQREVVDVLLSETIRRDEALQSEQTRKQCVFSDCFPHAVTMPSLLQSRLAIPPHTTRGRWPEYRTSSELSPVDKFY